MKKSLILTSQFLRKSMKEEKFLKTKEKLNSVEREKFLIDIEISFREKNKIERRKSKTCRQNITQATFLSKMRNKTKKNILNFKDIKKNPFAMSASILKVNAKRDGIMLRSRINARTLDSPTIMLQLSQSLCQNCDLDNLNKSDRDRLKSLIKNMPIDEERKEYYPIQEQEDDGQ